ncbi:lycopene cyclase domain-containing protein [Candidatus Gottesmanbacteria bacterium]|nr:lycopene cyclase domain-containing protein [Candidatus Gottesmanbacteria bacterium]
MFSHLSYLISIFFFSGIAVVLEWVFGFHVLKKYLKTIFITLIYALFFTLTESVALRSRIWSYNPETTFNTKIFGVEIETYVFTIFVTVTISGVVIAWTFYEDKGKPILLQSIRDVLKGTYAFWNKDRFKK